MKCLYCDEPLTMIESYPYCYPCKAYFNYTSNKLWDAFIENNHYMMHLDFDKQCSYLLKNGLPMVQFNYIIDITPKTFPAYIDRLLKIKAFL